VGDLRRWESLISALISRWTLHSLGIGLLVALRVAYTRPSVGQHCIVGNGMLSRVFVGLNKMFTQLSDDQRNWLNMHRRCLQMLRELLGVHSGTEPSGNNPEVHTLQSTQDHR
jgi:hypothetical protein